jgi:RecA/RadA recombinase
MAKKKNDSDNFIRELIAQVKDENTNLAADGLSAGEFTGFVDTGSYALNAVLSGSIYGGIADNKVTGFAGESSTGKTFFVLGIVKNFLDQNADGVVVYYDTEAAVTKDMMESRGVDVTRVIVSEQETIQKFRHNAIKMIDAYLAKPADKRPKLMFVLDSLGMLSTTKEMDDSTEGKETRDMTKSQVIKATFRVLTLKLAKAKIPFLITNHVYAAVGAYVPTNEISGGSGFKFAATTIAMLSKKKDREGTDVVGNIITVKMYKSRLSRENQLVHVRLSYSKGLDKYYGLSEIAEDGGIFVKVGNKLKMPDGKTIFEKALNRDPEKYYTEEVLEAIEAHVKKKFAYGLGDLDSELEEAYEEDEE